jgi:hypothetical protein
MRSFDKLAKLTKFSSLVILYSWHLCCSRIRTQRAHVARLCERLLWLVPLLDANDCLSSYVLNVAPADAVIFIFSDLFNVYGNPYPTLPCLTNTTPNECSLIQQCRWLANPIIPATKPFSAYSLRFSHYRHALPWAVPRSGQRLKG